MREKNIGNLITDLRKEQNISRNNLCEGLCEPGILSKLEMDESMPNILLVDRFLQRLGKSPDMFEVLLSDEEYNAMLERDEIEDALDRKDLTNAEKKLKAYIEKNTEPKNIQKQYHYQIKAILEKDRGNHDTSIAYLEDAINCTVPKFSMEQERKVRLCVSEIELLIMLADEYFEVGKTADAKAMLEFLISYMEENYTNSRELVKIYPKAVYLQAIHKENAGARMQCLSQCEKAFQYMIKEGTTIFLGEIMKILISIYKEMHLEKKAVRLEKQLRSLEKVYEEAEFRLYLSESSMGWFKEPIRRGYYLCSEVIRGQRLALGMSQEEVIEGIYENSESLARVEAGKQMPNHKTLGLLMEKLGLPVGRYNSDLVTDDYAVLEQQKRINNLMSRRDYENAKIELEKIRLLLDLRNPINRQYLDTEDAFFDFQLRIIGAEEFYERSLKSLEITYAIEKEILYRTPMLQEVTILNYLAIALWEQTKMEEAIVIFHRLNESYEKSKIQLKHQFYGRSVILENYAMALEVQGKLEEAHRICQKGLKMELMAGKGNGIDIYISEEMCIAEKSNLEEEEKKKAMEKYLSQAFYISDLFENKENNDVCDAYYKKVINPMVKWY